MIWIKIETLNISEHYKKIMELFLTKYELLTPKTIEMVCDYMDYGLHPRIIIDNDTKII